MSLIPAYQKDEMLLRDIQTAATNKTNLYVWWLGQSGYLIKWNGTHLLLDPYLSDSLTIKYAATDKPHVRMSELVIDPSRLDFIDIVTSSHNHTDHLDADTLIPIITNNPNIKFIIPEANRKFVSARCACPEDFPIGLIDGQSIHITNEIIFHGIPAAHESLDRNEAGYPVYMGYVIELGPYVIYHSGDTIPHPAIDAALEKFKIDLAFLPINGRAPERKVSGNFFIHEACDLALRHKVKILIPGHYDMFEFNTVDVAEFIKYADNHEVHYKVLRHGEGWTNYSN